MRPAFRLVSALTPPPRLPGVLSLEQDPGVVAGQFQPQVFVGTTVLALPRPVEAFLGPLATDGLVRQSFGVPPRGGRRPFTLATGVDDIPFAMERDGLRLGLLGLRPAEPKGRKSRTCGRLSSSGHPSWPENHPAFGVRPNLNPCLHGDPLHVAVANCKTKMGPLRTSPRSLFLGTRGQSVDGRTKGTFSPASIVGWIIVL